MISQVILIAWEKNLYILGLLGEFGSLFLPLLQLRLQQQSAISESVGTYLSISISKSGVNTGFSDLRIAYRVDKSAITRVINQTKPPPTKN